MKKNRKINRATNAIDPATTTNKDWGFTPVPNKGGKTTNYDAELKDAECRKIIFGENGGAVNA